MPFVPGQTGYRPVAPRGRTVACPAQTASGVGVPGWPQRAVLLTARGCLSSGRPPPRGSWVTVRGAHAFPLSQGPWHTPPTRHSNSRCPNNSKFRSLVPS